VYSFQSKQNPLQLTRRQWQMHSVVALLDSRSTAN
jgi:hypothetical protein